MNTPERLQLLASCASLFEPWTGPFDEHSLSAWIQAELGHPDALDRPTDYGPLRTRVRAPALLLHVVSANTPHAAMQSLLRGLTIGARNLIKLPSCGLPEVEAAIAELPVDLSRLVETVLALPDNWTELVEAVVVFGNDSTLAWFAAHTPPHIRLIPHGERLSIALIRGDLDSAARLAARDVSLFDQRGCLSLHNVYLASEAGSSTREFAAVLADEMRRFNQHTPRQTLAAEEAGAIATLRESIRFVAASDPDRLALWESEGTTEWTVVADQDSVIKLSPLNRFVYVKPWPATDIAESLGKQRRHLSALALHPFNPREAAALAELDLGATRICPLGETQNPSLFWHHDGLPPLASLVTWIDIG